MCIRDSSNSVGSKKEIKSGFSTESAVVVTHLSLGLTEKDPTPVSYTHLDVYKRQCIYLSYHLVLIHSKIICIGTVTNNL